MSSVALSLLISKLVSGQEKKRRFWGEGGIVLMKCLLKCDMFKTCFCPARTGSPLCCASPTRYCSSLSPKPVFWVSLLLQHLGVGQKSIPSENRKKEWINAWTNEWNNKQAKKATTNNQVHLLFEIIWTWSSKAKQKKPQDNYSLGAFSEYNFFILSISIKYNFIFPNTTQFKLQSTFMQ